MTDPNSLLNQQFNRWTVISYAGTNKFRRHTYKCQCQCGEVRIVEGVTLRNGHSKSCGCWDREKTIERNKARAIPLKTGDRFTRLVILDRCGDGRWLCFCECGNTVIATASNLTRSKGATKSCGCWDRERIIERNKARATHGQTRERKPTPTYLSWSSMWQRCRDKFNDDYNGRGIKVCDRWQSFENFLEDMGERPEGMTLDRIDYNGNYEPSNCRWADDTTQNRNRRNVQYIEFNGQSKTLKEWSEEIGISVSGIWQRARRGKPPLKELTDQLLPILVDGKPLEFKRLRKL